jgi:hypothetical protein
LLDRMVQNCDDAGGQSMQVYGGHQDLKCRIWRVLLDPKSSGAATGAGFLAANSSLRVKQLNL